MKKFQYWSLTWVATIFVLAPIMAIAYINPFWFRNAMFEWTLHLVELFDELRYVLIGERFTQKVIVYENLRD